MTRQNTNKLRSLDVCAALCFFLLPGSAGAEAGDFYHDAVSAKGLPVTTTSSSGVNTYAITPAAGEGGTIDPAKRVSGLERTRPLPSLRRRAGGRGRSQSAESPSVSQPG